MAHRDKPCLFYWDLGKPYTPICLSVKYAVIGLRLLLLAHKGDFSKYCSGSVHTGRIASRRHFLEPCLQWFTLAYTL